MYCVTLGVSYRHLSEGFRRAELPGQRRERRSHIFKIALRLGKGKLFRGLLTINLPFFGLVPFSIKHYCTLAYLHSRVQDD